MLAAATLLFLIALPIVNCRRRNAPRIEELDEDLRAKDYDQGKRDNGMNQAMNAYSRGDLEIIKKEEGIYSEKYVCNILSKAVELCGQSKICRLNGGQCRCRGGRAFNTECRSCVLEE